MKGSFCGLFLNIYLGTLSKWEAEETSSTDYSMAHYIIATRIIHLHSLNRWSGLSDEDCNFEHLQSDLLVSSDQAGQQMIFV